MDSHDIEAYFQQHRRTLAVLMLVVSIAAISAAFLSMRQTEAREAQEPVHVPAHEPSHESQVPVAPRYGEIPETEWLANRNWSFTLKNLPHAAPDPGPQLPLDASQLAATGC